jgi:hypothetical protein
MDAAWSRRSDSTAAKLIHRNARSAVARIVGTAAHPATVRRHQTRQNRREDLMTVSEQALLLTGELFVLSFVAILVFWFADKLRRSFTGKP